MRFSMNSKNTPPVLDALLIEALASASPADAPSADASARMREQLFQRVHQPAADYLFVHSHQGDWVRLRRGISQKLLREDAQTRSFLLRMEPGSRLPPHDHALDEEALVLEGDATINGVLCHAGDYHLAPHGKPHDWLTTESGCLLFIRGAADRHAR